MIVTTAALVVSASRLESAALGTPRTWSASAFLPFIKRKSHGFLFTNQARMQNDDQFVVANETQTFQVRPTRYSLNDDNCPPLDQDVLEATVTKHWDTLFSHYLPRKPVAKHSEQAFLVAKAFIQSFHSPLESQKPLDEHGDEHQSCDIPVVLDSGCGTGRSSLFLGKMHPDCAVIGIDRSLPRLRRYHHQEYSQNSTKNQKHQGKQREDCESFADATSADSEPFWYTPTCPNNNVLLLRADLPDFWRCWAMDMKTSTSQSGFSYHLKHHYILYPNPYPKKARFKHRWYAHPCFPLLFMLERGQAEGRMESASIIVRSNWKRYLQDFAAATVMLAEAVRDHPASFDDCFVNEYVTSAQECAPVLLNRKKNDGGLRTTAECGADAVDTCVEPMTNFEAKYWDCGEPTYQLCLKKQTARTDEGP